MFAAIALMAAGTVMQAQGQREAGAAANRAAQYNAQIARNNATIAKQNAEYATRVGISKAERESMKGRVAMGKIKTTQAASGIDTNTGSAVDVQEGAREANVLDTATVIQNAQLEAYGYRSQAANFRAKSYLDEMEGYDAERAGNTASTATLLSGAGKAASMGAK